MTETLTAERLVGRFGLVASVVDCLLDANGPGALILGDAGIGKTALVNEVVLELGTRIRPFYVYAGPTLSRVPYAALAPLLISLTPGETDQPRAVLKALMNELNPAAQRGSAQAVLVVEDAQHLDDHSAAVLAQLAAAEAARVVLLCRPHPSPPPEVLSMWSEGLVDRFELPPLTKDEVDELCARVLGSPLVPSASAVLFRSSGGNPMFLLELLQHARNRGHLLQRNDTWVLLGEPGGATVRLMDLVRNQIIQLNPEQRQALESVALAEAIPLSVLQRASDSRAVDELKELQFIAISQDAARHVRLAQPLIGEVIRQLVPTARSVTIRRRIVALMDSRPETLDGRLRHVTWALESGASVPDADILEAAQLANRLFIPDYVERVVGAIRDPASKLAAQVELARAKLYGRDPMGAALCLEGVVDQASDLRTVRQASILAAQLAMGHQDGPEDVLRAAAAWANAVSRLESADPGLDQNDVETARLGSRLLALQGYQAAGRHAETELELQQIWESTHDDDSRLLAGTLLAEVLALTGRAVSALQIMMVVQDILAASGDRRLEYTEFVMRRHLLALLLAGELDVLDHYLESHIAQASNSLIYFGGMLHLAAGTADLRRGTVGSALPKLSQAAEVLRLSDAGRDLPEALAATAYAASILGRVETARASADAYDALAPDQSHPSLLGRAHAIATRADRLGVPAAVAQLMALADAASASGVISYEVDILSLVLRLGDLTVIQRLASAADNCEGRSAEFVAAYCRAIAAKDVSRLVEMSDAAAQEGLDLAAAECAAHALRILETRGDKPRQFEAQKLVKQRTAALNKTGPSAAEVPPDLHKLTRREQEIAALVQASASNREIALQLGLSLRTVEGHLYRMFAKLGISHREDLVTVAYGARQAGAPPKA
ncbi:MAG: LuxR C-terminal-related transcriptional regulator [Arthrobacter sp.]